MTSTLTSVPAPSSAELSSLVQQIAADARRRRADGGHEPPTAAIALVKEHRLGAARVPVELGGGGYTLAQLFELVVDLAEADPDVPHILRVHFSFVEDILRVPSSEAKLKWLPHVVEGKLFGGANSELSSHNVGGGTFDSTLTPTATGYVVDGTKFYSTGSIYSDYIRVSGNLPDGEVLSAIVPTHSDGVEHRDDWDGIGQRHTGSGTTVFTRVEVDAGDTLPFRNEPIERRPRNSFVQLILHAIAAGILRSVTSDAADLLRSRKRTFTFAAAESPREDPQLLEIVGRLTSATFVAEAAVAAAAATQDIAADAARTTGVDRELEARASIAAAKTKVAIEDLALTAAGRLFEVGGASATRQGRSLDIHWRNLRTLFSHNPTSYKARVLGDIVVNDAELPEAGFF
ncbi:acyl-CoA dehydrogenase family protein [Rhodococcoides kyotonense]|uniref:Acyl-CoA dehydrogenase n=1 Tax=Rhodococcoides kyotonense TaxID=398843 RepID=A0A239G8P1_9NOCA|nr:acyl-CoA dehydrogenase family protein [Rhodococcus kyotonensis]SNS65509.1 Acyl-CoA dehydrogenase [Rhodococcus kyotonensis]